MPHRFVCPSCNGTGKINCTSKLGKPFTKGCRTCKLQGHLDLAKVRQGLVLMQSELNSLDASFFAPQVNSLQEALSVLSQPE